MKHLISTDPCKHDAWVSYFLTCLTDTSRLCWCCEPPPLWPNVAWGKLIIAVWSQSVFSTICFHKRCISNGDSLYSIHHALILIHTLSEESLPGNRSPCRSLTRFDIFRPCAFCLLAINCLCAVKSQRELGAHRGVGSIAQTLYSAMVPRTPDLDVVNTCTGCQADCNWLRGPSLPKRFIRFPGSINDAEAPIKLLARLASRPRVSQVLASCEADIAQARRYHHCHRHLQ